MTPLILESLLVLVRVEFMMGFGKIRAIREHAVACEVRTRTHQVQQNTAALCHAMDLACALYPKRVLCLQRSAATLFLLRHHGWNAQLVIGVQILPFKSHAWVELNRKVVSDKPYMRGMYHVVEVV